MEAILFLGMMGGGYLYNNITDKKEEKIIYDLPKKNTTYELSQDLSTDQFIDKSNNTIIGNDSDTNNKTGKMNEIYTNDEYINKIDFLTNDKNMTVQPFFRGNGPGITNIENDRLMESHMGGDFKPNKESIQPHFLPEKNIGNVYGSNFEGALSQKNRYNPGEKIRGELPFEKTHVRKIDSKSGIQNEVMRIDSERSSIDNIRTLSNQKNSYEGRVITGKGIDRRGEQAPVDKNRPYRDYENAPGRYFTSVAETEESMSRPEEILKSTNRTYLNKQEVGIASGGGGVYKESKRPRVQKSQKINLGTSSERNIKGEHERVIDYSLLGFKSYPNERQVTTERTVLNNLKTYISNPEIGLQDKIPTTKKQTMLYSDTRNPSSQIQQDSNRLQYCNMESDPSKEIISQGRDPTLSNVKLTNGVDNINMDIHKLESDSITQHGSGISKIYGKLPSDNTCQLTTDKDTLDNKKIDDRIYPELLDSFRKNPLTQSLSSYSY